jgi:hypothetical protein
MKQGIFLKYAIFLGILISLFACKKEEGEGGTSTIKGKIIVYDFDAGFTAIADTYPAVDEDIFIIYGEDHSSYDDDFKTSYDGSYEFKHLQKGKYKLFAYSKDSTGAYNGTLNSARPDVAKFAEVEVTSNGSTFDAPDIIILKNNY